MPGVTSKSSSSKHLNPQILTGSRHARKDTEVIMPSMGNSTCKMGLPACPIMDLSCVWVFMDVRRASWYMVQGAAQCLHGVFWGHGEGHLQRGQKVTTVCDEFLTMNCNWTIPQSWCLHVSPSHLVGAPMKLSLKATVWQPIAEMYLYK